MRGRQIKKGLLYFYNDVDMYRDIRIRKLIHRKGGQAATVYHILLCEIYRQGYYLPWDDDLPFILSEVSGFEEDYISEAIEYSITIGLFDRTLFDTDRVLTSVAIQQCYFTAVKDARRKTGDHLPYFLLTPEQAGVSVSSSTQLTLNFDQKSPENPEENSDSTSDGLISSEENAISSEEINENSEEMTQIKENKRKDNSLRSLSSSSTTPSPAHARDFFPVEDETITAVSAVALLKADADWLSQMQRRHHLSSADLLAWLDAFVVDCDCRGKQEHTSLSDFMQHFNDWLLKQRKSGSESGSKKKTRSTATPLRLWQLALSDLCNAVTKDVSSRYFETMRFESYENNTLLLQIPYENLDYLEDQLSPLLRRVLTKHFGPKFYLNYRPINND